MHAYGDFTTPPWSRFVLHLLTNPSTCTERGGAVLQMVDSNRAPVDAPSGSLTELSSHVGRLFGGEAV